MQHQRQFGHAQERVVVHRRQRQGHHAQVLGRVLAHVGDRDRRVGEELREPGPQLLRGPGNYLDRQV